LVKKKMNINIKLNFNQIFEHPYHEILKN